MLKETLETVPVALLMTLVLWYGVETGRSPEPRRPTPGRLVVITGIPSEPTPCSTSVSFRESFDSISVAADRRAGLASRDRSAPRLFMTFKTAGAGVPRFTAEDIEQHTALTRRRASVEADRRQEPAHPVERGPSLSNATLEDLTKIPGIGPLKAMTILERRPPGGFCDWAEIDALPGFGRGTIEMLKLHIGLN